MTVVIAFSVYYFKKERERVISFCECTISKLGKFKFKSTNILDCLKTVKKDFNTNLFYLFKNYIVLPITTCECERCFSCLCRLKTNLRSTMLETRVSSLALMYEHRDKVNLPEDVVNMFMKCHNKNPLFN